MAQRPWQETAAPPLAEAASSFRTPPREYGAIHGAIWGEELTRERIVREFDSLTRSGVYVVNFGPGQWGLLNFHRLDGNVWLMVMVASP